MAGLKKKDKLRGKVIGKSASGTGLKIKQDDGKETWINLSKGLPPEIIAGIELGVMIATEVSDYNKGGKTRFYFDKIAVEEEGNRGNKKHEEHHEEVKNELRSVEEDLNNDSDKSFFEELDEELQPAGPEATETFGLEGREQMERESVIFEAINENNKKLELIEKDINRVKREIYEGRDFKGPISDRELQVQALKASTQQFAFLISSGYSELISEGVVKDVASLVKAIKDIAPKLQEEIADNMEFLYFRMRELPARFKEYEAQKRMSESSGPGK